MKFRHLLNEALRLTQPQVALLAVLMLRGPQTTAELRARSERLHSFASAEAVADELSTLAERDLVRLLSRRPGEREERWTQLLGQPSAVTDATPATDRAGDTAETRIAELERRLDRLEARLDAAGL